MHYYKRNIGDYAKKAGRLSMLQHGSYTLLIDSCYDREKFPTMEEAIEWTWASTKEEIEAVQFVLSRFFQLEDGIYVQNHIKEDLEKYNERSVKNTEIAKNREANKPKRERVVHESLPSSITTTNQEPLTTNQEPLTTNQELNSKTEPESKALSPEAPKSSVKQSLLDLGVTEQVAIDYLAIRKAKKSPLTQTAIAGIQREANKAGISFADAVGVSTENGWQGFKADWYQNLKPSPGKAGMSPETREFFNTNYDRKEAVRKQKEHALARGIDYDNIKDEDLIF